MPGSLLVAVLYLAAGLYFVMHPVLGVASFTLLLACFLCPKLMAAPAEHEPIDGAREARPRVARKLAVCFRVLLDALGVDGYRRVDAWHDLGKYPLGPLFPLRELKLAVLAIGIIF